MAAALTLLATELRLLAALLTAAVLEEIVLGETVPEMAVILPVTPEVLNTKLLKLVELTKSVLSDGAMDVPELECEEEVIVIVVTGLATVAVIVVVPVCAWRP